ncbi:hypothetical protein [Alicyclobacillus sp. ALC3]|uniref:hypothetical protein n=1 Tax=Alicyclobacillus sp. ALC3 TaxID=2796143 RepID=UPI0023786F09|nr:hypothetical protein [Alicyclobacillus sp. ALC3]WDL99133.1 hypothetical protein JC200_11075 [Alicyclobacillus sp. ALC3]
MTELWKFLVSYYVLEAVIVVLAIVATWWGRKKRLRSKQNQGPPTGFVKTNEVFVDPTTNITQQVWYNPSTGERHYETLDKK